MTNNSITIKFEGKEMIVDDVKLQKMASIYYALENGLKVIKLKGEGYECIYEDGSKIKLNKFLKNHMNTKKILK